MCPCLLQPQQPEPHISDEYNSRDWYSLAEGDQLSRLTNDQLKV